jgi:hypothetical protein
MIVELDTSSADSYRMFIRVKSLPSVRFVGRTAVVPDEYAHMLKPELPPVALPDYEPIGGSFDYQQGVSRLSIRKRKFAAFMSCGSGKTIVIDEYARYVNRIIGPDKRVLIVTPLMVVPQMIAEAERFYSGTEFKVEQVRAARLPSWVAEPGPVVGITNYEALTEKVPQGRLGALILDESSMLKSEWGKHARECIRLGEGLSWKLCATGTPAPNDRTEFANHAVFLDQFPTTNSFLARYFVNKGKTGERWELKGHAADAFYKDLSHWCIFLNNPAVYGWKDNTDNIPPINVNINDVELTLEQKVAATDGTGMLFPIHAGGITRRAEMSRIAKGRHKGKKISTNKFEFIRDLIASWTPEESTIVWALHNAEQDELEKVLSGCASIRGATSYTQRLEFIRDFQAGKRKILVSKAKILGLGLNLQISTRHVFSSCVDSFESFFQAIKRSNRYGSTLPLNVHIPVSDLEVPMMETVLAKWKVVQQDTEICERVFRVHLHNAGLIGGEAVHDVHVA